MAEEEGGFLSRWSQRKAAVKQGIEVPAQTSPAVPAAEAAPVMPVAPPPAQPVAEAPPPPPPPTLADVAQLTKDSNFARFVAPDVDASVKNAAMKKLFASDPHFNVMDGLDVYIDDYNKFEPIPKSILRQLMSARMLGLLDDELEEQPKPDNPDAPEAQAPLHEDADLQLQPDDAAGRREPGEGVADGADPGATPPDPVPPRSA